MRSLAPLLLLVGVGCGSAHSGAGGQDPVDAPDLATPSEASSPDLGHVDTSDDGGTVAGDGGVVVSDGTATITGMMGGYSLDTVRSVVAVVDGQSFEIYISDRANLCSILQMGSSAKDTSIFRIGASAGMAPHTFPAGTYTYPSGAGSGAGGGTGGGGMGGGTGGGTGMGTRDAVIMASGANCIYDGYNQASMGGFTITAPVAPDATVIDGTFDIQFDTALQTGRFMGSFHAPVCPHATNIPQTPVYCE
jgi:hypothetical protein